MNNKAYTTVVESSWARFKHLFKEHTEDAYSWFLFQNERNDAATIAQIHMLFLWRFRAMEHYFLDKGVAEFCENSVRDFTPEYCKTLPLCTLVNQPTLPLYPPVNQPTENGGLPFWPYLDGAEDKMQGAFAIHFPSSERTRSVLCIPDYLSLMPVNDVPEGYIAGVLHYYFAAYDGDEIILMQPTPGALDFGNNMAKLIFGLSLYMDAFPDAVIESVSGTIHKVNHYQGTRHCVTRNEIIDEEHRHSVSPHWRRGHFRLLSSPKFIRKQGQTIYVRGTFVKGKAFDVMDDAPPYANIEQERTG